jgi:hypothetical protein
MQQTRAATDSLQFVIQLHRTCYEREKCRRKSRKYCQWAEAPYSYLSKKTAVNFVKVIDTNIYACKKETVSEC